MSSEKERIVEDAAASEVDSKTTEAKLEEGVDYHIENGLFVFTSTFLLKRGYCCESGCRHCPYQE